MKSGKEAKGKKTKIKNSESKKESIRTKGREMNREKEERNRVKINQQGRKSKT